MARTRESGELPTKEAVLQFIKQQRSPVGRREIAREFRLDSADRQHLVDLLDAMEDEKIIHRARNRRYSTGAEIPSVGVLEVTGLDKDGEPVMSIVGQDEAAPAIKIHLARGHQRGRAPGIGDRVLARLDRKSDNYYVAHVMRRLETPSSRVFGIFRTDSRGGQIQPASKRLKSNFHVAAGNTGGAEDGEFVAADVVRGRLFGMPIAKITERIGAANEPAAITRLAIASNDIPEEFSPEAIAEADAALEAPLMKPRATSMTRYGQSRIRRPATREDGTSLSRLPTSPGMSDPTAPSTTAHINAAIRFICRTRSSRCCPGRFPTDGVR
jgi:ribonuclease R